MIRPRSAAVYARGDLLAVVSVDWNVSGHGVIRPEPAVLSRKSTTSAEIGTAVVTALAAVQFDIPRRAWDDPNVPKLWQALGFNREATFLRDVRSIDITQLDDGRMRAEPTSRRGGTFSALRHPGFLAPLTGRDAVGRAVLDALAESSG